MVLKRGLLLAIFLALLVIFVQLDNVKSQPKVTQSASVSFFNATIYDIGENYLSIKAKKC